jgi:hypothetical protein
MTNGDEVTSWQAHHRALLHAKAKVDLLVATLAGVHDGMAAELIAAVVEAVGPHHDRMTMGPGTDAIGAAESVHRQLEEIIHTTAGIAQSLADYAARF